MGEDDGVMKRRLVCDVCTWEFDPLATKHMSCPGCGKIYNSFQVDGDKLVKVLAERDANKIASKHAGLKKGDIDLAAFSVDKIVAFTGSEVKALHELGLRNLQDLDAFGTRIRTIIDDVVKMSTRYLAASMTVPSSVISGLTKYEEKTGYEYHLHDSIKVLGKTYRSMIFQVAGKDKDAFENVSNAPCVSVKLRFDGIHEKLKVPVFTVMGFGKNEEMSKLLELEG